MKTIQIWVSHKIKDFYNLTNVVATQANIVLVQVDNVDITRLDIDDVSYTVHPIQG